MAAPAPRRASPIAPPPIAKAGRGEIAIDPAATSGALVVQIPDATAKAADAVVTSLPDAETERLLARLEPLPDLTAQHAPSIRPPSAPPPRSGTTQPIAFVVPHGTAVAEAPLAPVVVDRRLAPPQISPQGDVRAESEVRVRFDEPMVAVAQVGSVANPPAAIAPAVAGTWRWLDTRVLTFTAAAARLPAATEFTVTVAAGTRASSGAVLAVAAQQTFATSPVTITGTFPTSTVRPDSPIVVNLDQDIDEARILPLLRVETPKGKPVAVRAIALADALARWRRNPSLGNTLPPTLEPHHVILVPVTEWPAGIRARVALKPGAPSREGSRVTVRESDTGFEVAPAFAVRGITCDGSDPKMSGAKCPAQGSLMLEVTNSIDEVTYRSSKFQIEGEAFQDHEASGSWVSLSTPAAAGKQFTVTVGEGLVDIYGQGLIGPKRPTFTTTAERFEPYLYAPSGLVVLDPRFEIPQWLVSTQAVGAVRVQLYRVTPADYFAFEAYEAGTRATPPGKQVYDKAFTVGARYGANLRVDLRPALEAAGTGHVIAIATATQGVGKHTAWIQVTKLGLSARLDGDHANVWVSDINPTSFLRPTAGAAASLVIDGRPDVRPSSVTDAAGHAALDLPEALPTPAKPRPRPTALLEIKSATDSTFAAIHSAHDRAVREHDALWYATDDRFTYKPGETVYVKGWVRWTDTGVNPGLAMPAAGDTIGYQLVDARGNQLATGAAPLSDQGGFHVEVALAANVNLGTAVFTFTTKTSSHRHPISVQEFRTPAFAVDLNDDVTHSGATPLILGDTIEMAATAKYYTGGGLAGAKLDWSASLSAASYQPPGWNPFTFAPTRPRGGRYDWFRSTEAQRATTLSGASAASIVFGLAALPGDHPSLLTVDATVTDLDRLSIRASSRAIVVHPSAYYVGLRQRPSGVLETVATDIDGHAVPGVTIDVTLEGVLGSERSRDDAVVVDTQRCHLTSEAKPVVCTWTRRDDTTVYTAVARVTDARGRGNAAQLELPWYVRADRNEDLAVIPDRVLYRPGDVARLEIRSAVVPATAVLSFARQGVIAQQRVELAAKSTYVDLPIEASYLENIYVLVDRWGAKQHPLGSSPLPLPAHAIAEVNLAVDIESARLVMTARATQPMVQPGELATFEVEVRHDDKPTANAEVALMVVDEAVLSLSDLKFGDPLRPFYRAVGAGTWRLDTLVLVDDAGLELAGKPGFSRYKLDEGVGGGGAGWGTIGTGSYGTIGHGAGSGSGVVTARKDFRANAVFSPLLHTDAHGKATLTVKMPDSLTRFRIVALATSGTGYFGKAEGTIVTQRRITARMVAPRFLSQGDSIALPVVVQNLDTAPRTIEVAVRAANLVATGPSGKRVTIGGGQRAELRFAFTTKQRGRVAIQTIATSGDFADASTIELPVYEPATTESFATYGTVDDAARFEQVAVPAKLFTEVGGVDVEVASTQLEALTDAFWYLYAYPYECAEQRSGRMLATAAMADVLDAFATPGRPTHEELAATRKNDLVQLGKEQRPDGGWGYFHAMESDPYVTMQVLSALAAEHVAGPVSQRAAAFVTKQATALLAGLEHAAASPPRLRGDRNASIYRVSLAAAALSALAADGVDVQARARRLHAAAITLDTYPMDAKARLLSIVAKRADAKAMRATLVMQLISAIHETAASATVTADYVDAERLLLVSSTKTSALGLDALMREVPEHALVTKLAHGVLESRRAGRWASTQENVVVLGVMRRYFDIYERVTPSFTGKLWFGNAAYAEQSFVGHSSVHASAHVDWTTLVPGTTHDLALVKAGAGRMYYRVGITYAPAQTDLPALDAGFLVRRTYTPVDDPGDVTRRADGTWKIRLGARVLVTVQALNTTKRFGVALVDPLPAGFEAVNDRLANAERPVSVSADSYWNYRNLRDNRSEVFAMELDEGTHQFSYTVRATTPGTFLAAPAKAEEMYSPETFGRSTGQRVTIE